MKYDNCNVVVMDAKQNQNISYGKIKRKRFAKLSLLDIFVVQSIVCAAISCAVLVARMITLG